MQKDYVIIDNNILKRDSINMIKINISNPAIQKKYAINIEIYTNIKNLKEITKKVLISEEEYKKIAIDNGLRILTSKIMNYIATHEIWNFKEEIPNIIRSLKWIK